MPHRLNGTDCRLWCDALESLHAIGSGGVVMRGSGVLGLAALAWLAVFRVEAEEKGFSLLFADGLEGFEPGVCQSFSWSGQAGTLQLGGPPSVRRYAGLCGFRVDLPTLGHLSDDTPFDEPSYSARFALFTGSSGEVEIFRAENASSQVAFSLRLDAANERITLHSGASSSSMPASSAPANRWVIVSLSYSSSGVLQVRTTHRGVAVTSSTIPAVGLNVDRVRLGALSVVGAGGALHFDDFESLRSLGFPSGSCRGDANGDGSLTSADRTPIRDERLGRELSTGQPDCNEDGNVNVLDLVCVIARNAASEVCP